MAWTVRIARIAAAGLMLALSGGCWEEIRYTPRSATTPALEGTSTPNDSDESPPAAVATAKEATPLPPAVETPAAEPAQTATPVAPAVTPPSTVAPAEPTAPGTPAESASAEDRTHVWEAAGKWSLAWAIYAKGLEASRYESILAEANAAAAKLGVELPPLPSSVDVADRERAVVEALRGEAEKQLVSRFGERFTPAEAAEAELAIGSNVLLLTYSPRSEGLVIQTDELRKAAQDSALPAELWETLLKLLDGRASYLDVRQAVFEMHRGVAKRLSAK